SGSTATVERTLVTALEQLTGESPVLIAAGRTDAGVHALGQCVNFHLDSGFPVAELPGALNSRLGPDVVVRSAEIVADSFHARYSARLRRYEAADRRGPGRGRPRAPSTGLDRPPAGRQRDRTASRPAVWAGAGRGGLLT